MKASRACSSYLAFMIALWAPSAYAGWTTAVRISDEGTAYNPRIVANGDTLHAVYWISSGADRAYYVRSTDGGEQWAVPFRLGDSLIAGGENSPVIQSAGDTIATIWHQNLPGGGNIISDSDPQQMAAELGEALHTFCLPIITKFKSMHLLSDGAKTTFYTTDGLRR